MVSISSGCAVTTKIAGGVSAAHAGLATTMHTIRSNMLPTPKGRFIMLCAIDQSFLVDLLSFNKNRAKSSYNVDKI
jgi:hypothetical protein